MGLLVFAPAVAAVAISSLVLWVAVSLSRVDRDRAWSTIALTSAAALTYSSADVLSGLFPTPTAIAWLARCQLAAAAAWVWFAAKDHLSVTSTSQRVWRRTVTALCAVTFALAFVPNALIRDGSRTERVAALDSSFESSTSTSLGNACAALLVVTVVWLLAQLFRRRKSGRPGDRTAWIPMALVLLGGSNDALLASGAVSSVPLLDFGFAAQGLFAVGAMVLRTTEALGSLRHLTEELENKVAVRSSELARTREEALRNEKLAALGRLAAGVAHEINNPAGVVLASLQYVDRALASGAPQPDDAREAIADATTAITRISRVVRQMQDSGRVASGVPIELTAVALGPCVEEAIALGSPSRPPTVEVVARVEGELWAVGHPQLLQQALLNLILNAQQAAGHGGRVGKVQVRGEVTGGQCRLWVEDDGAGVPDDRQVHLFEPFFSTRGVGEGMGLGLSVAHGLVQALRGELVLEGSRPGRTIFRVSLPAANPPGVPAPAPSPLPVRRRIQVLLIDDDRLVLRAISRQLSTVYEVAAVTSVAEGVALIAEQPARFQAVLCDVMMPDGGGRLFLDQVRQKWPALEGRTLFITGGTTTPMDDEFQEANASRVLRKPFDARTVLEAVAARVGPSAQSLAPATPVRTRG